MEDPSKLSNDQEKRFELTTQIANSMAGRLERTRALARSAIDDLIAASKEARAFMALTGEAGKQPIKPLEHLDNAHANAEGDALAIADDLEAAFKISEIVAIRARDEAERLSSQQKDE